MKYKNQMILSGEVIHDIIETLLQRKHDCEARLERLVQGSPLRIQAQEELDKAKMTYDAFIDAYVHMKLVKADSLVNV